MDDKDDKVDVVFKVIPGVQIPLWTIRTPISPAIVKPVIIVQIPLWTIRTVMTEKSFNA